MDVVCFLTNCDGNSTDLAPTYFSRSMGHPGGEEEYVILRVIGEGVLSGISDGDR